MGQRLNLEVRDGDKVLANAYYHWSAYTMPALYLLGIAIEQYKNAKALGGVKLATEILLATDAGFNDDEIKRAKEIPEFAGIELKPATSRNEGLLSITPEGIKETQEWAEETIIFDIGSDEIDFGVYFREYRVEFIDLYGLDAYDLLPQLDNDPLDATLKYYELDKLKELIENNPNGFRDSEGNVVLWIA